MIFLASMVLGYASHFGLYDLCRSLPFPELAGYAAGVALVYPVARYRHERGDTFEASFWLSFQGYSIGVLIARIQAKINGGTKK